MRLPKARQHQQQSEIDTARTYQRALFEAALAGLTWPSVYGGQDLPADADSIFEEEAQHFELPTSPLTLALKVCGPAVLQFGTSRTEGATPGSHAAREELWCQLWSEPEAGSDLANVRTHATRSPTDPGSSTGNKIWTSHGARC